MGKAFGIFSRESMAARSQELYWLVGEPTFKPHFSQRMGTNVVSVAFSPDGKLLASISGGEFHDLELWDISKANIDAALEQISFKQMRKPLLRCLAKGEAHYKEEYLLG